MSEVTSQPNCPQCGAALPGEGFAGLCPRCVASSLHTDWDLLGDGAMPGDAAPVVRGWQMIEPMGAGGQGIVWRAMRTADMTPAAVKVFRQDRAGGWEAAARMELESGALAKLDHPGIVRVLDSGETADERFFIATELIEGCDLHRLLRAEKLPPARALAIAENVAEAIGHAHGRGVVHRDLKPANVLIGRSGVVKLVDFSLARRTGPQSPGVTVTREGVVFGTPYYLAPEVMRGGTATAASDLYALGVMLYEMLTGAPPAGRFSRVSEKCELPREADALIESLLAEEPGKRPASGEAAARALKEIRFQLHGVVAARARRQRLKIAALIALIACGAAAAGYFAPRPQAPLAAPPKLNAKNFPNPAAATRAQPFVNGLGMQFIPVPGVAPLVARHETTMRDFLKSVVDGNAEKEWQEAFGGTMGTRTPAADLRATGWEYLPEPLIGVSTLSLVPVPENGAAGGINITMARRFCAWLTWREQREGRLSPGEFYRLPTDEEWSAAAGMPAETEPSVEKRSMSLKSAAYPWGDAWPPPPGFGNYAGTEARDSNWPKHWLSLPAENDRFARLAPVGSFAESPTGLFDLWGNVWEWCDSRQSAVSANMVLRGGSWVDGGYQPQFRRDYRRFERAGIRETCIGFRCVLVVPGR